MGCWNETCGFTRLPIKNGDRVVVVITASPMPSYAESYVYYNDKAVMHGMAFRGEYDDYGSVENIDCNPLLQDFLLKQEYYEKTRSEEIKKFVPKTMENLCDKISEGCIYIGKSIRTNEGAALRLFMMHEELYDILMNHYKNRKCYKSDITEHEVAVFDINGFIREFRKWEAPEPDNERKWYMKARLSAYCYAREYVFFPLFIDYLGQLILLQDNQEVVDLLVERYEFASIMSLSRNGFFGLCGQGSQSREMMMHKLIAEFTLKKIQETVDEAREWDEEGQQSSEEEILEEVGFVPRELKNN